MKAKNTKRHFVMIFEDTKKHEVFKDAETLAENLSEEDALNVPVFFDVYADSDYYSFQALSSDGRACVVSRA